MERRAFDYDRDIDLLTEMQARSFEINFPDEPFIERFFRDSLHPLGRGQAVYIYEDDGEVLGWLWLDYTRRYATAHIRHIQVAESRWGEGLGRALLQEALTLARQARCREVTLNVTKANLRAMALYASLGFETQVDVGERQYMTLRLDADAHDKPLSG